MMANRSTLAFNKLEDFKGWLVSNECILLETKGVYEVLRWKSDVAGEAMPIIFKKSGAKMHLSCNDIAASYVRAWLRRRNK